MKINKPKKTTNEQTNSDSYTQAEENIRSSLRRFTSRIASIAWPMPRSLELYLGLRHGCRGPGPWTSRDLSQSSAVVCQGCGHWLHLLCLHSAPRTETCKLNVDCTEPEHGRGESGESHWMDGAGKAGRPAGGARMSAGWDPKRSPHF